MRDRAPDDTDPAVEGRLGAASVGEATRFEVWAPWASGVDVVLDSAERRQALDVDGTAGTWVGVVDGVGHGDRYRFSLDGGDPLPDPASRWQPDGVHGPSAVVDPATFRWIDESWGGIEGGVAGTVLYELHVGTFTPEGTFHAAIGELARLVSLGVTAVELMPINAFPGERNWGYDGVFVSAAQQSYGGPEGLARFVDAAHELGLGVVLDVVYNHLGPEGNVLGRYGPYFTDDFVTPWGQAVNVAQAGSDHVRRTFIESARGWVQDFHVDGFRLDAVGFILDPTAKPFLEELTTAVHIAGERAGRTVLVTAESADNDPRLITPVADGGIGCDASWSDDWHHALRVALTGDRRGYYEDYDGVDDLAEALRSGWVFNGRYSSYRGRHHGRPLDLVRTPHRQLVVFTGNHDQIGNSPAGDRPPFDHGQRLLAAAALLLSPHTPLLFMGEEYAETAPFPYFDDHGDPALVEATRRGRGEEFFRAGWTEPIADPGDPETFRRAVLDPSLASREPHRSVLAAYTELIAIRRAKPVLTDPAAVHAVGGDGDVIVVERRLGNVLATLTLRFSTTGAIGDGDRPPDAEALFDSHDPRWWPDDATPEGPSRAVLTFMSSG